MLNSTVLVLNRSYLPIHVTSVRRAFSLIYQDQARVLNEEYATFDFASWRRLSAPREAECIGTSSGAIRVPRVIVLIAFDRIPKRHVRYSRVNIFARDKFTCQYCGEQAAPLPAQPGSRDPALARRQDLVGERGVQLRRVQSTQGRTHTRAGASAPASGAVAAELGAAHEPDRVERAL